MQNSVFSKIFQKIKRRMKFACFGRIKMRLIDADALRCLPGYIIFAPTIDAAPVVHAHIIVNWLGDCRCSNCEKSIDATSNYCNWCGVKLDEPEQCE